MYVFVTASRPCIGAARHTCLGIQKLLTADKYNRLVHSFKLINPTSKLFYKMFQLDNYKLSEY